MRRLCFGGSFNPIHHGHLLCARAVAETAGFDRVALIPNAISPLKLDAPQLAPAHHRVAMCRLAVEGDELFEVEDLELTRPGPSYTIDTARELLRRGWGQVHWLIGSDAVPLLSKWHEPDALLNEVTFVVMARPGHPLDRASLPPPLQQVYDNLVPVKQVEISATETRSRATAGRSIRYLVPPAVADYITRHGLYR